MSELKLRHPERHGSHKKAVRSEEAVLECFGKARAAHWTKHSAVDWLEETIAVEERRGFRGEVGCL